MDSKASKTKGNNSKSSNGNTSEMTLANSQVESNPNDDEQHHSSSTNLRYPDNLQIVQIGQVSYHNFVIGIFTDFPEKNPRRFFFEPIALLDLKSISSQTNQIFKQDVVHFTLKMWNTELRFKVLERVQSMPTFKELQIHEEDICVMRFEEVQLVLNPGSSTDQSVQLMDQPTLSFHSSHSSERLHFYFICDSRPTADSLAENLREYPGFVLHKWRLALECRGLVLGNGAPSKSPAVTIDVSTLPPQEVVAEDRSAIGPIDEKTKQPVTPLLALLKEDSANLSQDLTDWMAAMIDKKKWTNAIPVFSAKKCRNTDDCLTILFRQTARKSTSGKEPPRVKPGLLGFAVIETASSKHGTFDLVNGRFTVKTAGVYLFHFSGYYSTKPNKPVPDSASIQLRVDGYPVARSAPRVGLSADVNPDEEPESVVVSSFLWLKESDVVDCFSDELYLREQSNYWYQDGDIMKQMKKEVTTRFSAFYFSDE